MYKIISLIIILYTIQVSATAQQLGAAVPNITLNNSKDSATSLHSYKGKVVLLDFWATWCKPCLQANVGFKKLYQKYASKGLEIFSVSVDVDIARWKSYILTQKIPWVQVNDPGNWYAPTAVNWGIDALPTTFLIDKKGVLRYYNQEGKGLRTKIEQLLAE